MRFAVLIDVVSADDVRMVEFAGGSRLTIETLQGRGIVFEFVLRQNLERHVALHENLFAEIDRAHAAGADRLQQLVLAAQQKATPFPDENLFGLEDGQQAVTDHPLGQGLRLFEGGS